jgi:hypothetical protein
LAFLEVSLVVEVEMRKSVAEPEKTVLDVNEIIGRVRGFVDSIKEMSLGGQPMAVSVEGFNFSVGKAGGEYTLGVKLNLVFKPKEPLSIASEPF